MQESIPALEEELEDTVTEFFRNVADNRSPVMKNIDTSRYFEGDRSFMLREDDKKDETEIKRFSATSEIPVETILYGSVVEILRCFVPAAEEMASQKAIMMFEVLDQATAKIGNVVDGKGQPLSHELILEALEKIELDFDRDGNPLLPTMVVAPSVAERIKQLKADPSYAEFQDRHEKLIEEKRRQWRAREADRTLVG